MAKPLPLELRPQALSAGAALGSLRQATHNLVDSPLYKAASLIPGPNVPMNALAYGSHVDRGQTGEAVLDSAAMVPGVGLVGPAAGGLKAAMNVMKSNPFRLGDPRIAARMVGRKVGVGMQGEQVADAGISNAQAIGF